MANNTIKHATIKFEKMDKKGMYVNNTFELNNMYNEVTINGETFKPADKFNSFRISKFRN